MRRADDSVDDLVDESSGEGAGEDPACMAWMYDVPLRRRSRVT
jgi:hypothetical protein